jgi:hypothetical protein
MSRKRGGGTVFGWGQSGKGGKRKDSQFKDMNGNRFGGWSELEEDGMRRLVDIAKRTKSGVVADKMGFEMLGVAQEQEEEKNTEREHLSRDSMSGGQFVDWLAGETEAVETAGDDPKEKEGGGEEENKKIHANVWLRNICLKQNCE